MKIKAQILVIVSLTMILPLLFACGKEEEEIDESKYIIDLSETKIREVEDDNDFFEFALNKFRGTPSKTDVNWSYMPDHMISCCLNPIANASYTRTYYIFVDGEITAYISVLRDTHGELKASMATKPDDFSKSFFERALAEDFRFGMITFDDGSSYYITDKGECVPFPDNQTKHTQEEIQNEVLGYFYPLNSTIDMVRVKLTKVHEHAGE